LDKQVQKPDQREYTIKIIPHQGETVRSIRLPIRMIKYGIMSITIGIVLFIGAFGYSTYSLHLAGSDQAEITELRQVNSIQQSQILQLAKKASTLQDDIDKLNQMEAEIRRISSINDGDDANPGAGGTHDGQGGPLIQPNIQNLSDTLDAIEKNIAIRKQSLEDLKEKISVQQEVIAVTPSIWPATGDVSSPYGLRWGGTDFHPGIDIANDAGTPIVATADGIVTTAGWNSGGYGNMVDIDHGNGMMTRYGHAQRVVVTTGQQVKRGQVIAYMGSTGFSTGPHVHYEVRVNGKPVNPSSYL